jgi:hypothetical protein
LAVEGGWFLYCWCSTELPGTVARSAADSASEALCTVCVAVAAARRIIEYILLRVPHLALALPQVSCPGLSDSLGGQGQQQRMPSPCAVTREGFTDAATCMVTKAADGAVGCALQPLEPPEAPSLGMTWSTELAELQATTRSHSQQCNRCTTRAKC